MTTPLDAGRRVELLFCDEDRKLEVAAADHDPELFAEALMDAIASHGADDAERLLRARFEPRGLPEP